jgi:NADP-dependent 3-hydroxy acid dehydrogenase YdfG
MPFVRTYFRETQELVFDAHNKGFLFYGGVCRRGIYDNMKTAVEAIFVGKARLVRAVLPQMLERKRGKIVVTGSTAGIKGEASCATLATGIT